MIAFYNLALKIGIIWAKKLVKPIAEAKNAIFISYVWFIHSWIKKFWKNTL